MISFSQKGGRVLLIIGTLLLGVGLIPFLNLASAEINWALFSGLYEADLEVDESKGAPGSAFVFHGSNYPANQPAIIYVDGLPHGMVTTDSTGQATFIIATSSNDALTEYTVTMEVNLNASASDSFELESDEPLLGIPPGNSSPVFTLGDISQVFLPLVIK